jgi:hypothetical protein
VFSIGADVKIDDVPVEQHHWICSCSDHDGTTEEVLTSIMAFLDRVSQFYTILTAEIEVPPHKNAT